MDCEYCGNPIPQEKLIRRGHKGSPRFCNRSHLVEWRKEQNFYQQMSNTGKEARSQAVTESNHTHPRRAKQRANATPPVAITDYT